MYKVVQLLRRRPQTPQAQFVREWTAEVGVPRPAGLVRHVHNQPVGADTPIRNTASAACDGVDELWFDSAAAAADYFASAFYREHWLERRRHLLAEPEPEVVSGQPHLIVERTPVAATQAAVKLMILPRRRADFGRQQFHDYWIDQHVPLALSGPRTRERLLKLEICLSAHAELPGVKTAAFDGASVIVFESAEALQSEFESDHYRSRLAPDEPKFSDAASSRSLMVVPMPIFAR